MDTHGTLSTAPDRELVARWRGQPAPLLPLLHAFHERDGQLSDEALRAVSEGLRIPLAELYGTVSFYHHFAREPGGRDVPRVCTGPVCALRGAAKLLDELHARPMPCAGRCDAPIPVLTAGELRAGTDAASLVSVPSPLPPPAEGREECVFAAIREPERAGVAGYRRGGGYAALASALQRGPAAVLDEIRKSGLAGRGGAGYPTGTKWQAVADATGEPKTIVCNADEGEPGCFKDRALLDHDPHAVIEGMLLSALATGATRGFVYLRYEYPQTVAILESALAQAESAGLLGNDALDGRGFRIWLRRGAGAYVCGEEGSLLESLEGRRPFPRNRPPYPVTHGYEGRPTVVNNVETLASAAPILRNGASWYRGLGRGEHAGTKVISLSGDVRRPGNYEVPLGLPLSELLHDLAGGPPEGRSIQAVTMAGLSGGFLAAADLDVTLDEPSLRQRGSVLGAGGIIVFDDSRDMLAVARGALEFFAAESCGKCFPCRIGTRRLAERLAGDAGPKDLAQWRAEVEELGATLRATSACGLGMAAPLVTDSLLRYFGERVRAHVESGTR